MVIRRERLIQLYVVLCLAICPLLRSQTSLQEREGSEVLATVERFGGFAGVHETFTFWNDGKIVNDSGTIHRIPAAELSSILRRVTTLDLPKSCQINIPVGLCWDCFQYRITLRHPSGVRIITLDEARMGGQDSVSTLARSFRDLVSRLK
jgi:hypothetical protein